MDQYNNQDSPLSTSSNIIGILTFVIAIAAAAYARISYLRNSDDEYFRIKSSLSWYKTESAWLAELLKALNDGQQLSSPGGGGGGTGGTGGGYSLRSSRQKTEHQMHRFVMDDLLNLEQRLLDLITDIEIKAAARYESSWTVLPRRWWSEGRPSVAVSWLSVRTKALELVRQREALTARVQFLQISLISSRITDLESRMKVRELGSEKSWMMNGSG